MNPLWRRRFKAFFVAVLGLFYDVRVTKRGKVHLLLRDKREEHKQAKKIRRWKERLAR